MKIKHPYQPIHIYACTGGIIQTYIQKMKIWAYIFNKIHTEMEKNVYRSKDNRDKIKEAIRKNKDIFGEKVTLVRRTNHLGKNKKAVSYVPISWGQLMHQVRDNLEAMGVDDAELMGDCRVSLATRLYMVGLGKAKASREEVATMFRLVEHTVANDENIIHILQTENETYELDTPKGINKLANHIVELCLSGMIRSDTALVTLELLEKKIMFSETAHLLPNFERMKGIVKPAQISSSSSD